MIVIDFLFNICFAPFQKVKANGRLAALIWLTPLLTSTIMGILNVLLYAALGSVTSILSPLALGIFMLLLFAAIYLFLDRIYLKGNRSAGDIKFPILYGLLLPILVIGSIVFFSLTIYKFG
jgi:hypothetical protein